MRFSTRYTPLLLALLLCVFPAACKAEPSGASQQIVVNVKNKAEQSQQRLKYHLEQGHDVGHIIHMMQQVKTLGEKGDLTEAEALLDKIHAAFDVLDKTPEVIPESALFTQPVEVAIEGYDGDAMEPFISRDGQYLFFNSMDDDNQKDMYYATRSGENRFRFQRAFAEINTKEVDGVPAMDRQNNFYFISTAHYSLFNKVSAYQAKFRDGKIEDVRPIKSLSLRKAGWLNMDVEISADGNTLYYSNAYFGDGAPPTKSFLSYAVRDGDSFKPAADTAEIFKNLNRDEIIYAPAISPDELTISYTRLSNRHKLEQALFHTLIATRSDKNAPFGVPQIIPVITGFAEAPSISGDGKKIYFHKKPPEAAHFKIYMTQRKD
tara:strand:- start:502 stop:1632 length:1131 start_codon:yes stop_codon:yes gene_type:complete